MSGLLRAFLVVFLVVLTVYTLIVVAEYGPNLFPVYFGDMADLNWRGQFNLDFMGFLILSLLWVTWRHHFSPLGLVLGFFAGIGGMVFLCIYLLVIGAQAKGDMQEVFLGKQRASALPKS